MSYDDRLVLERIEARLAAIEALLRAPSTRQTPPDGSVPGGVTYLRHLPVRRFMPGAGVVMEPIEPAGIVRAWDSERNG